MCLNIDNEFRIALQRRCHSPPVGAGGETPLPGEQCKTNQALENIMCLVMRISAATLQESAEWAVMQENQQKGTRWSA